MTLEEIESRIAALKKRYEELDAKSCKAGVWDGVVMTAMSAVDDEIKRLNVLREKALVSDLVADPAEASVRNSEFIPSLPMPRDFTHGPGDEINPLDDLTVMPDGEAGAEVWGKLFSFMLARTTDYISTVRETQKSVRPARYTEGQHLAVLAMFALVQTEYRTLSAYGRDRRNEVEKRLLERIEALEALPTLRYRGTWAPDTQHNEGDIVTDHGSAWHCNRSTRSRPGQSDDWTLMVKKGAPGKDAK